MEKFQHDNDNRFFEYIYDQKFLDSSLNTKESCSTHLSINDFEFYSKMRISPQNV